MDERRKIVMENGLEMLGRGFGASVDAVNEIVFNTAMAGYQEIVTDPSYTAQAVVMTYPLIGNYGITDEDYETKTPTLGGMIVREYNDMPSNFRYTKTLSEILEENGIPGIQGVDTRRLTRVIRDEGSQKGLVTSADTPHEEAMEILYPDLESFAEKYNKFAYRNLDSDMLGYINTLWEELKIN